MTKKQTKRSAAPGKKLGRPKGRTTVKTTVSFRVPVEVEDAFGDLVDFESSKRIGSDATHTELYNRALGDFLLKNGVLIPGYNAPKAAAAS